LGGNLFKLPYEEWLPRKRTLQPVFTKQHVRQFGGHMAEAAEKVSAGWVDGAVVDLDAECRTLTLQALGRSVLGLDLNDRLDDIDEPLRTALSYAMWELGRHPTFRTCLRLKSPSHLTANWSPTTCLA
jgi:cytochrome P450